MLSLRLRRQLIDRHWIIVAILTGCLASCWQSTPKGDALEPVPNAVGGRVTVAQVGADSQTRAFETRLSAVPSLVDVARHAGIDFSFYTDAVPGRFLLPEVMGGGAGWLDYDGDGRLDLYVRDGCQILTPNETPPRHISRLFRNLGNSRFQDVTLASDAGFRGYGQGCAVGDFNVDGYPDLYLTNYGQSALFRNNVNLL